MLIEVLPEKFNRFIIRNGPYICYYNNEKNLLNRPLVNKILEYEKQYMMVMVLKLDWFQHKEYFRIENETECNRMIVYSAGKKIVNLIRPESNEIINMFKLCQEMGELVNIKQSQDVLKKEIIWKNITFADKSGKSKNETGVEYLKNKDDNKKFIESNILNIHDKKAETGCFISRTLTLNKSCQLSNKILNKNLESGSNLQLSKIANRKLSQPVRKKKLNRKIKIKQSKNVASKYGSLKKSLLKYSESNIKFEI